MIPINLRNGGRLGNRMIRYMFARFLQDHLGPSTLHGYDLPEWNLRAAPVTLPGRVLRLDAGHRHSPVSIARRLNRGIYDSLELGAYFQRIEYFTDRARCAGFFPGPPPPDPHLLGPGHITVHVRAADVLSRPHPLYAPAAPAFLEQVVARSGLTPVILGQLGDDGYSAEIRRRFAGCTFLPARPVAADFAFLRCSTNIVLSVSTFAWLAAWLSDTTRQIHMPLQGLYLPKVAQDVDLLPTRDPRYRYYAGPDFTWTGAPEQWAVLMAPVGDYPEVAPAAIRGLFP